jgi:molybdate transport system ATP-binding protein
MSRIAAIVYGPDQDCDRLLAELARGWRQAGLRVAGLVQINGGDASCDTLEMELEAIDTGRRFNICQDLGAGSVNACRLDPAGLAEAAGALRAALAEPVDLVIVNKFGRMEAEGQGLIAEIGEAVAAGLPLIIGVPERFAGAWEAFAGGLDTRLACDAAALETWRRCLQPALAAE